VALSRGNRTAARQRAQLLIIFAYRYAKPGRIAPFNYSVVVFSGLIGWIVWHNRPDALALVGVLLVSAGGIFTTLKGGPNTRGHFGWIGHWNADLLHAQTLGKTMDVKTISGDDVQCVLKWDASPLFEQEEELGFAAGGHHIYLTLQYLKKRSIPNGWPAPRRHRHGAGQLFSTT
jgi:hypothetical protein